MFIMTCRSSDREMFPLPSWADISQCDPSYHIYPELTLSNMVKASLMSCSSRSVSIWIVLNRIHIITFYFRPWKPSWRGNQETWWSRWHLCRSCWWSPGAPPAWGSPLSACRQLDVVYRQTMRPPPHLSRLPSLLVGSVPLLSASRLKLSWKQRTACSGSRDTILLLIAVSLLLIVLSSVFRSPRPVTPTSLLTWSPSLSWSPLKLKLQIHLSSRFISEFWRCDQCLCQACHPSRTRLIDWYKF